MRPSGLEWPRELGGKPGASGVPETGRGELICEGGETMRVGYRPSRLFDFDANALCVHWKQCLAV